MIFNSIVFAVFLPLVFGLYWILPHRGRNLFIIAASALFYGWWDWRFLGLILLTAGVDFWVALRLEKTTRLRYRKAWLALSLITNLGVLGFFKYFNFFLSSAMELLAWFRIQPDINTLKIVLPVGISFYTFQALSYTIDIYRGKMSATRDWKAYFAFIMFFPQLVAGPIERAAHLLPQFLTPRTFDRQKAFAGLKLMLWGLFKKVVIADGLAQLVNPVFDMGDGRPAVLAIAAAVGFTLQIYCDFSGYSDIARGTSRLFGFELMQNFNIPFLATSIRNFWQRWHISLSGWFKDYLYIPLGGNRVSGIKVWRNLMITFLVSGLWHGANWTFVIWGGMHGLAMCLSSLIPDNKTRLPTWLGTLLTFTWVCLAFVFFRAVSITQAVELLLDMFTQWDTPEALWQLLMQVYGSPASLMLLLFSLLLLFTVEAGGLSITRFNKLPMPLRWTAYYTLIAIILLAGVFSNAPQFIYFNF